MSVFSYRGVTLQRYPIEFPGCNCLRFLGIRDDEEKSLANNWWMLIPTEVLNCFRNTFAIADQFCCNEGQTVLGGNLLHQMKQ